MKKIIFLSVIALLLESCGGGGEIEPGRFNKPRWVTASSSAVSIAGRLAKVVYVSNYQGGDIVPIDTEKMKIIDTDLFDSATTTIAVGKGLGKVLVRDSSEDGYSFDIFVASEEGESIYLLRALESGDASKRYLGHSFVEIGMTEVCTFSKPYFEDKGDASNPSIGDVTMLPGTTRTENWLVRHDGENYTVEGSVSGLQTNLAKENTPYTSDGGEIAFTIFSGSKSTTKKDNFTFGTTCTKPLLLDGRPSDFIFEDDKLFVAIRDKAKISVYDDALSFIQDIDLDDLSGDTFEPDGIVSFDGDLYVSNGNGDTIARIDPIGYSSDYFDVGGPISYLGSSLDFIYLLSQDTKEIHEFSASSGTVTRSLGLSEVPRGFVLISDSSEGHKRAFVTNTGNYMDNIDLTDMEIIDRNTSSGQQSFYKSVEFYDSGAVSKPKLTDVSTTDGETKSERWLLTYNGAISGTYSETGTISGTDLGDVNASFVSMGVIPGDMIVINPFEGEKEEVMIDSITDENNIVLSETPSNTGSSLIYQIRSNGNYTVFGSISGIQAARLYEGINYTVDDSSMSMNVIGSLDNPTTEGDYFTFLTGDGIDSMNLKSKMLPYHMENVLRQSDSREYVYIACEGSNNVSVVDVLELKEVNTID